MFYKSNAAHLFQRIQNSAVCIGVEEVEGGRVGRSVEEMVRKARNERRSRP